MQAMIATTDRSARAGSHFAKACFAQAMASVNHERIERFIAKDDEITGRILQRATALPGSTTAVGFAAELARDAFPGFLASLAPYSAAARLIAQAVKASVGPVDESKYPVRASGPAVPAWVLENGAIPVRSAAFSLITIGPAKKMAHILTWSRELGKRSDAQRIFETMLREDVAAGIDAAFFATTAGSATQPAGLLFGVTPLTASGASGKVALIEDLSALAAAVATGGSGDVTFAMSPERLAQLRIIAPELVATTDLVASAAIPATRVVAVDGAALLVAIDDAPDIMQSQDAVLHMSDVPLELVDDAGVKGDPLRSLWQTAASAVRVIHEIDFVKRRAGAVAYLDGAGWS